MTTAGDAHQHELEALATELWTLAEHGREGVAELRTTSRLSAVDVVLARLVQGGYASIQGADVRLTVAGRSFAAAHVRRHRLAEVLVATVVGVARDGGNNPAACAIEHVLDPSMTESICRFLGHPKACPHGKPIPAGECCRRIGQRPEPAVEPLDRLPEGQDARIVYIAPRNPQHLVRLSGFGVVPGALLRVQQRRPTAVLRVGETTLAVEPEIAGEIYVRRVS